MRRPADASRTDVAASLEPDVVPASGVYRAVIILLAVWTIFAGLALSTQGVGALSMGGGNTAERVVGAYMLMTVPIYALIVWRPGEHWHLRWIPYAAQMAIILPFLWDVLITTDHDFFDGALLFVVSSVFLGVLVYLRTSTHPLGFFAEQFEDEEDDDELSEEDEYEDEEDEEESGDAAPDASPSSRQARGRRYRRSN